MLSIEIIEKNYLELSEFKQKINLAIDKLIDQHYTNLDNEILLSGEILKEYIEKRLSCDELQLLDIETISAIHEYLFNKFNKPTQFLMIHESIWIKGYGRYYDAYLRIMVKNKKIWIENWISNDDCDDENEYQYNLSCCITEQQRNRLYGKKQLVNTYNRLTNDFSYINLD